MSRFEHARVTLRGDSTQVWGTTSVWEVKGTHHEPLHDHDERDAAICRLGAAGFELFLVTHDAENADGVWEESLWLKRVLIANPIEE